MLRRSRPPTDDAQPDRQLDGQLDWVERATGEARGRLTVARPHATRCRLCGRPLRGHASRAHGLGPVCRGEIESSARGRISDPATADWLDAAADPAAGGLDR